jgi:hypothetical protein
VRRRLSRARLVELADQVSGRERQVTEAVVALRLVGGRQLERLFFADVASDASRARLARRTLARLVRLGVLGRLERRIGGVRAGASGFVYFDAPAAQRLVAYWQGEGLRRPRAAYEPGRAFVAHRLAISEWFVRLSEAERNGQVELLAFDSEPAIPFTGEGRGRGVLRPDARVRLGVGDVELHSFLEVDCGTEGRVALTRKAGAYVAAWRSGAVGTVFPRVAWITESERRVELLTEVCASMPPASWKLFVITTPERALDTLTSVPGEFS